MKSVEDRKQMEEYMEEQGMWRILRMLKEELSEQCDSFFEMAKQICPDKPGREYSILFKVFHKLKDLWRGYAAFCEWWDFRNFMPEDYICESLPDGTKLPISTVESAYMAYAKKLLEESDSEKIRVFISQLKAVYEQHREMKYLEYYTIKLQLKIGDKNFSINKLLPFARKKKTEPWIWKLLAELQPEYSDEQLSCLWRALDCEAQEKFLLKIRERLVECLIARRAYSNAKYQISEILDCRRRNSFAISQKIRDWTNSEWYINAGISSVESDMKWKEISNDILYSDMQKISAVVTHVNTVKKKAYVNYGFKKNGFFKFQSFFDDLRSGETISMRCSSIAKTGYIKVHFATKCPDVVPPAAPDQ